MFSFRRIASTFVLVAAAMGVVTFGAPAATADTVLMKYQCSTVVGGLWYYDWRISIGAPAVATHGQTVTMEVIAESTLTGTEPVAANVVQGGLYINLGGANTGVITTNTMTNPAIEAGTPLRLVGSAQVTPANIGDVSYRPDRFAYGAGGGGLYCFPKTGFVPPVAATTHVV